DEEGMQISDITDHYFKSKLVYTAPSHQFPLGGTLSLARRFALLDWANKQEKWIFEDDYNSEFRYGTHPIQALQGLDQQQRVIYSGTFTKMMFPEFRLGFMVVPEALIE
ncbi:PLP-dependent aminotransferase family protein, partial [Acinetobacter sp. 11520]|nr:PLP-dependent aminotransferase family protein [Acinetobacter sp. 11520]